MTRKCDFMQVNNNRPILKPIKDDGPLKPIDVDKPSGDPGTIKFANARKSNFDTLM